LGDGDEGISKFVIQEFITCPCCGYEIRDLQSVCGSCPYLMIAGGANSGSVVRENLIFAVVAHMHEVASCTGIQYSIFYVGCCAVASGFDAIGVVDFFARERNDI
jgi:hypothetical protein